MVVDDPWDFELDLDLDRHLDLHRLLAPEYLKGLEEMTVAEVRDRRDACDVVEDALSYLRRCVQVKLDIVLADLERRAGGLTGANLAQVVEQLPEILSDGGRSGAPRGACDETSARMSTTASSPPSSIASSTWTRRQGSSG